MDALFYVLAVLLGSAVGASELLSRYRDAPLALFRSWPGLAYVGLNGLASVLALILSRVFQWRFGVSETASDWQLATVQLLVAGFAAMAVFRSSLFNVQAGDTQVAVGPSSVLQILLTVLDREVDRVRAAPRAQEVADIMRDVDFGKAKNALPTFCFELMQNVTPEEVLAMRNTVDALAAETEMPARAKSYVLGLHLMNIVGEDVLRKAVASLQDEIGSGVR